MGSFPLPVSKKMTAFFLFLLGYTLNMFYITVLYHRGLAHGSVKLGPKMLRFLEKTGIWVTGLDPKAWALMHRMHHLHSDQEKDPHSPLHGGIFKVWISQYRSYRFFFERMKQEDDPELNKVMSDIPLKVGQINSNLPYIVHISIAIILGIYFESTITGLGYFLGIMGHPVQGWMINALAHSYGARSYETNDNSRNNLILGYLIFGEGLQNNHHAFPGRANFAIKSPEFDPGYVLCKISSRLNLIRL